MVISHGVTGNKDEPFVVALAEGLATAGFPALSSRFLETGIPRKNLPTVAQAKKWGT